jgi:hypothetical protein
METALDLVTGTGIAWKMAVGAKLAGGGRDFFGKSAGHPPFGSLV